VDSLNYSLSFLDSSSDLISEQVLPQSGTDTEILDAYSKSLTSVVTKGQTDVRQTAESTGR
jgi:hypothetical protein